MSPDARHTAASYTIRSPRGSALSCQGWQQEAVLRMLLNCLDAEVAERPQDLVMGGHPGKVAADRDSLDSIIASLRQLSADESLAVESGKPAGIYPTNALSPRLLSTSAARKLENEAVGNWLYAGTQTALPNLYELYAASAGWHFGGTLAGKLVVGAGLGAAGGAQPLAAALNGAAFLGIDPDPERIKRRVKSGYCEVMVNNLDEALRVLKNAVRQRKSASVGLIGNGADLFPQLARRGVVPDLFTICTPPETAPDGYIPAGMDAAAALSARRADPDYLRRRAQESIAIQNAGARDLENLGARFITAAIASDYFGSLSSDGSRLTTWMALSGEPSDIARVDRLALEIFPDDQRLQRWLPLAGRYVRFQGLPARVAWLRESKFGEFRHAVNELVQRRELSAPILLGCRFSSEPSAKAASVSASEALKAGTPPDPTGACWIWRSGSGDLAHAYVADGTADALPGG